MFWSKEDASAMQQEAVVDVLKMKWENMVESLVYDWSEQTGREPGEEPEQEFAAGDGEMSSFVWDKVYAEGGEFMGDADYLLECWIYSRYGDRAALRQDVATACEKWAALAGQKEALAAR